MGNMHKDHQEEPLPKRESLRLGVGVGCPRLGKGRHPRSPWGTILFGELGLLPVTTTQGVAPDQKASPCFKPSAQESSGGLLGFLGYQKCQLKQGVTQGDMAYWGEMLVVF